MFLKPKNFLLRDEAGNILRLKPTVIATRDSKTKLKKKAENV